MKTESVIVGLAEFTVLCLYIFTGAWLIELVYAMTREEE